MIFLPSRSSCWMFAIGQVQPPPQALRFSHGRGERETRVTGDEPQGTMGRVQTAGEAPARSCVVFLAKESFSWHSTISSVKMSSDDSTTLEDLEESFDDLTVSGKSHFSIAFVVYYRIWITNYSADSQSLKIMFFPFLSRPIQRTTHKYSRER